MAERSATESAAAAGPRRKAGTRGMPREEREPLILEVAGQVFARRGYHSASMDEIAELAGVSKPMVYAYFGSKEQLYLAYVDHIGRELLGRLVRAASPEDPPVVALRTRIVEFLTFIEQHRDGWTLLQREMTFNPPVADQVAELRGQIADAVRRMLEEAGLPQSPLPPRAADAIAHGIVGAGEALANWWLDHPGVSREELADWYLGLVQAAVTAAAGRPVSTQ